ncbi:hypothetical protein [Polluticoccus soli]|uniref:hypothetical protein n=1 Tax=Polluticoccus soli TaxID=3034150 RepID=UPI0023E19590|nr:hypothetical protein [Flavipsychrobacter sp. JY13-12]
MVYTVRGNRNKGFTFTDENGNIYGRVEYNNWFSRKAVITLNTHDHYEIVPSGFWQTSFDIIKAEYKAGEIRMNWRGNMNIALHGKNYLLKRTGFWQRSIVLKIGDTELATIKQSYEWANMGYAYESRLKDHDMSPELLAVMLITIYCTNQQYASSGVA